MYKTASVAHAMQAARNITRDKQQASLEHSVKTLVQFVLRRSVL